jgi:hypothetical protein
MVKGGIGMIKRVMFSAFVVELWIAVMTITDYSLAILFPKRWPYELYTGLSIAMFKGFLIIFFILFIAWEITKCLNPNSLFKRVLFCAFVMEIWIAVLAILDNCLATLGGRGWPFDLLSGVSVSMILMFIVIFPIFISALIIIQWLDPKLFKNHKNIFWFASGSFPIIDFATSIISYHVPYAVLPDPQRTISLLSVIFVAFIISYFGVKRWGEKDLSGIE